MKRHRFETLDGLRGVAAVSVVVLHQRYSFGNAFHHAYLAVDLFFLLSGFVIAHAYAERLSSGRMSYRQFVAARVVRLFPMVVLGALLGAALGLSGAGHLAPRDALTYAARELVLWPSQGDKLFPLNNPMWSLFFEMVASLAFGLVASWASLRNAGITTVVLGLALIAVGFQHGGIDVGFGAATFTSGFIRAGFGFSAGVLLWRLHQANHLPSLRVGFWWLTGALLIAFGLPLADSAAYDLACAFVVFPLTICAGAHGMSKGVTGQVERRSGELSYPLYCIHLPLLQAFPGFYNRLIMRAEPSPWTWALVIATVIFAAALTYKFYDAPVRLFVGNQIAARSRRPAVA